MVADGTAIARYHFLPRVIQADAGSKERTTGLDAKSLADMSAVSFGMQC